MRHINLANSIYLVSTVWLASACVQDSMHDVGTGEQALQDPQGTYLLGPQAESLAGAVAGEYVSVNGTAMIGTPLRVVESRLQKYLVHAGWSDVTPQDLPLQFQTRGGDDLEFTSMSTDDFMHEHLWGTQAHTYQITNLATGASICIDRAWLVPGTLTTTGDYTYDPAGIMFTLACSGTVVAKCINQWGYAPWEDPERFHACTRMGRADYAGDGKAHTVDGTMIDIHDDKINADYPSPSDPNSSWPFASSPLQLPPAGQSPEYYFEAAWRPDGAYCMSRARWSTLAPGGPYNDTQLDPRFNLNIKYCDDIFSYQCESNNENCRFYSSEGTGTGIFLFNNSQINDRGLWQWRNIDENSLTTAVRGHCDGVAGQSVEPATGFDRATYLGSVLTQPEAGTIPLYSWRNRDRWVTSTADPPLWATEIQEEGHIFAQQSDARQFLGHMLDYGARAVELRRIQDPMTSRWETTTEEPPAGATVETLGWIIVHRAHYMNAPECTI